MAVARAQAALRDGADFDVVLATSYENVAYLSGAFIITQRSIPDRLGAVVIPREGPPAMVVCNIEESLARRDSRIADIRTYVEFEMSPVEAIASVLREKGLERATIGFEARVLTAHYFEELKSRLPHANLRPADAFLNGLRMIKTEDEIALLERAALATDRTIRSAFESSGPGTPEKAVADAMAGGLQQNGADALAFLVLAAGPSAGIVHAAAQNRALERGDLLRCDIGGYFSGYYSDLARTAVVGRAAPQQRDIYRRLWEVHDEVIGQARPGVHAKDLFFACDQAFKRRGMEVSLPHIGHSLGIGLHEHPVLHPFNDTVLREGMVLAIEPVYRTDGAIYHVEDLVAVTASGPRVLSRSADWSDLVVAG